MVEPPPDPKRQRLDEEEVLDEAEAPEEAEDGQGEEEVDPAVYGVDQETYQAYLNQQAVLDQVAEECSDAILKVEHEFAKKKRPMYAERNSTLRNVPGFWKQVLSSHPQFRQYFTDVDLAVLDHLVEVDVDDSDDPSRTGWKIRFAFDENPFFTNTEIIKEFSYPEESSGLASSCTEIHWRPGKAPASDDPEAAAAAVGSKRSEPDNDYNFVSNWLKGEEAVYGGSDALAEILRDEIWPNPMKILTEGVGEEDADEEGAVGEFEVAEGEEDEFEDVGEFDEGGVIAVGDEEDEGEDQLEYDDNDQQQQEEGGHQQQQKATRENRLKRRE